MLYDIHADEYSEREYKGSYRAIKTALTMFAKISDEKRAYILGGQPGAGKSTFYAGNGALSDYVVIDGDQCRRYHPKYRDIVKYDLDNYANRTQPFVNRVIEQLISDLSADGYNIIVEGTLRNPDVPIRTCDLLKSKGYNTKLIVVTCDAEQSWQSTIRRAQLMQEMGEKPRLVPIDKYDTIVNNLPRSIDMVVDNGCFDSVSIISRNSEVLYRQGDNCRPSSVIENALKLDDWNEHFAQHAQGYLSAKIDLIKKESERLYDRQEHLPCTHEEMSARER